MRNGRIPPYIVPVVAFLAVAVIYALTRGTLTPKGVIIGLVGAIAIILIFSAMNRGPYI